MSLREFGNGFPLGVATAAYQIEGSRTPTAGTVDLGTPSPTGLARSPTAAPATSPRTRTAFPEDVALVLPGLRCIPLLAELAPHPADGRTINRAGLDHYMNESSTPASARASNPGSRSTTGISPGPEGWGRLDEPRDRRRIRQYVAVVGDTLGDRVTNWMLFNEPLSFTMLGYMLGEHAPGRRGLNNFFPPSTTSTSRRRRARVRCARHRHGSRGGNHPLPHPRPGLGPRPNLALRAERAANAMLNRAFLEPGLGLGYPVDDAPILRMMRRSIQDGDLERCRSRSRLRQGCSTTPACGHHSVRSLGCGPSGLRRRPDVEDLHGLGDPPEAWGWCSTWSTRTTGSRGSS